MTRPITLLSLVLVCLGESASSPGAEPLPGASYRVTLEVLPPEMNPRKTRFELWIPPIPKQRPIRGVLAVSDYASAGRLHTDPNWRALAASLDFACLRYSLVDRRNRLSLSKGAPAARVLLSSMEAFAPEAKRPELAHAGLVLCGLSQGGWQATALAMHLPDRVIAAVPIHAATPVRAPDLLQHAAGRSVPQLHVLGGRCFLTPYLDAWVRRARQRGAVWSVCLQPNTGHADVGDLGFARLWIAAVARARVPATIPRDRRYPLRPLPPESGWRGRLELSFDGDFVPFDKLPDPASEAARDRAVRTRKLTRVRSAEIEAAANAERAAAGCWLPNRAVAQNWLDRHKP